MPANLLLYVAGALAISLPLGIFMFVRRQRRAKEKTSGKDQLLTAVLGWRPSSRRIVLKKLPFNQGRAVWSEGETTRWDVRAEPGFTETLVIEEGGKASQIMPCVCVDLDRKVVVRYEHIEAELKEAVELKVDAKESGVKASRADRLAARVAPVSVAGVLATSAPPVPAGAGPTAAAAGGPGTVAVYQPAYVSFQGKTVNEDDPVEITLADGTRRSFKGIWRMINGQFLYDNYVSDDWRKINEYLEPWWARFAKYLPWLLIPITVLLVVMLFR